MLTEKQKQEARGIMVQAITALRVDLKLSENDIAWVLADELAEAVLKMYAGDKGMTPQDAIELYQAEALRVIHYLGRFEVEENLDAMDGKSRH